MIVNHLSRLMGERRMNVATLARETGIARSTLSECYHGAMQRYDAKTLDRLCRHLNVSLAELLEYVADDHAAKRRSAAAIAADGAGVKHGADAAGHNAVQ